MNLVDLGKTVAKFAPFLGSVLPIPGGAILGQAIAQAFGGDLNDPHDLIKRIENDPEAQIKLFNLQCDHQVQIEKIKLGYFEAETKDRESARQREIELAKSGHDDLTPRNLAYITTFGFLIVIFSIPFLPIDGTDKEIMMMLVGIIAAKFSSVIDYYFGSSSRNQK